MTEEVRSRQPFVLLFSDNAILPVLSDVVRAAGCFCVSTDSPEEARDITNVTDAVMLDLGSPSQGKTEAMINAGKEANRKGIPVVFHPDGVWMSAFRQEIASMILREVRVDCIRGRREEIDLLFALLMENRYATGAYLPNERLCRLAQDTRSIIVVNGDEDIVADAERAEVINNIRKVPRYLNGIGNIIAALLTLYMGAGAKRKRAQKIDTPDDNIIQFSSLAERTISLSDRFDLARECVNDFTDACDEAVSMMVRNGSGGMGAFRSFFLDRVSLKGL